MAKLIKFLIAVLLLPVLVITTAETVRILVHVLGDYHTVLPFAGGMALYAIIHYTCYNFSRFYVFGHELTHAFAAWLCGFRVSKISVKRESGYVKMDKINAFVVLAPYFIPFYLLISALVYGIAGLCTDVTPFRPYVLVWLGGCLAFHFIQTFHTLWEADQPDLKLAGGKIFSLVTIVLANMFILACVLKVLFPQDVSLQAAGLRVVKGSINSWRIIVNYIVEKVTNL